MNQTHVEQSRPAQMTAPARPLVVGIGGTTGTNSSSERALRAALAAAERYGAKTEIVSGTDLMLPMYTPDASNRTEQAVRLVSLLRRCDGVIVATPAYHGIMSGLIKNALDYVEDLRTDERCYLDERAVACIVSAAGWQAVGSTLGALRSIIHSLRGWPTPSSAAFNTLDPAFRSEIVFDLKSPDLQLDRIAKQVVAFAQMKNRSH
jgi:FMN reductase